MVSARIYFAQGTDVVKVCCPVVQRLRVVVTSQGQMRQGWDPGALSDYRQCLGTASALSS